MVIFIFQCLACAQFVFCLPVLVIFLTPAARPAAGIHQHWVWWRLLSPAWLRRVFEELAVVQIWTSFSLGKRISSCGLFVVCVACEPDFSLGCVTPPVFTLLCLCFIIFFNDLVFLGIGWI